MADKNDELEQTLHIDGDETPQDAPEETSESVTEPSAVPAKTPSKGRFKAFLASKKGKIIVLVSVAALVVATLFAVPASRYGIAGLVVKKTVHLTVVDTDSQKPVSGATVVLGGKVTTSDRNGKATLNDIAVGEYRLKVSKKYYRDTSLPYTVPLLTRPGDVQPSLKATGRTVELTVVNSISGVPVAGAQITISGTTALSNDSGIASVILPVKADQQTGTVKKAGYNDAAVAVTVTNSDDQKLNLAFVPSGKLYFLSKRTGVINVNRSNLDGSAPEVIVAGTGQESDYSTVLLATTDWRYLALHTTRDSDKPKIYLIDTSTNKMTVIDEGAANFQLAGWTGHSFVYRADRNTANYWDNKRQALKSFNADTETLTLLDETSGAGSSYYDAAYENIDSIYVLGKTVLYTKTWSVNWPVDDASKKSAIMSVATDGTQKARLKEFALNQMSYFEAKLYAPGEVYLRVVARDSSQPNSYYEYEDGKLTATADTNDQKFTNSYYATYLVSPSGKKTLWYEPRDGKNVIFVGDEHGRNGRQVGSDDYVPFGWHSDDYLLFSKGGSQLFALGVDGTIDATHQPVKITDYHKAQLTFLGYGSGYGGL